MKSENCKLACPGLYCWFDIIFTNFSDLLHGRRIARALWDYYKVSGIITDSCYVDPRDIKVSLFNFCFQYFCDIDNLMEMILFSGFWFRRNRGCRFICFEVERIIQSWWTLWQLFIFWRWWRFRYNCLSAVCLQFWTKNDILL